MLHALPRTRDHRISIRVAGILIFTVLTILSARFTVEIGPVPITMQVLVVLLSGMVLGSREGAWSQILYVGLIAAGFPFDARGLGAAAFASPTGGFLVGFIAAAYITGLLTERNSDRFWIRFLAGIAGVVVIHAFGFMYFQALPLARITPDANPAEKVGFIRAWQWGVAPFILIDAIKALLASGLTESARALLNQQDRANKRK